MISGGNAARIGVFKHQSDAAIDQADPVSGTQYPVLTTKTNVRILGISANCTWTVQPTPLEVHVVIDGQTITFSFTNPVSATNYNARGVETDAATAQVLDTTVWMSYRSFLFEGRSVAVYAEITGGTVQALACRVKWSRC